MWKLWNPKRLILDDKKLKLASNYFYRKATAEVKQFVNKDTYNHLCSEKNEILYYTWRILQEQNYNNVSNITVAMKDLSMLTFCVSTVEKHSPLAYSIINEVH